MNRIHNIAKGEWIAEQVRIAKEQTQAQNALKRARDASFVALLDEWMLEDERNALLDTLPDDNEAFSKALQAAAELADTLGVLAETAKITEWLNDEPDDLRRDLLGAENY